MQIHELVVLKIRAKLDQFMLKNNTVVGDVYLFTSVDHVFVGSKFAYSILHLIALVQHVDYLAPSWFL